MWGANGASAADVRKWARSVGYLDIGTRGIIAQEIVDAYNEAHS